MVYMVCAGHGSGKVILANGKHINSRGQNVAIGHAMIHWQMVLTV